MDIIENFNISVPINENFNFLNTINNLQENIIQIINFNNVEDENVQINIEFEYINSEPTEYNNYFKNCNEINNYLCKPIKIKKCDNILKDTCFICMENYLCNEFKRELPSCKHYFHKKCIDKWLKTKASCPVCRDQLLK